MTNNPLHIVEELNDLNDEIKDAEKELSNDQENLANAMKYVQQSQVNLARAIIAKDKFLKENKDKLGDTNYDDQPF